MVKMGKVFLVLLFCVVAISAGWAAVTLDDVAKDVTILKVAVAELTVRMDSLDASNGRLFTLMLSLFGIIIAILSGMAWTLINISKDIRVPKEERVSKLEAIMEKVKDHLKEIDDKLHIPRSVLVFLIGISLLCGLTSASWAATLDDVAKGLQQLQIGQAELKARVDILLMLYGIFVAVLAGMVWALIGLSKEVRIPKEERVSKLEVFMEKVKDHLKEIDDKLHIPRSVLVFLVGISLIFGLTSASWAAATLDEVAKGLQQLQIGQARLEARFDGLDKRMDEGFKNFETRMDERLRYLDWKLNLMLVLVISILGFVFYLAKEIGFGVRERVKELFARLQVIEEKIHIPHIPKSVFLVLLFCVVATTSSWAVPNAINVQGRLTNASGPVTDTALETTFTIYRAGTVAWSDTYNVNYQNGLFNQIIEESSGHLFPLFVEDAAYTLGVTIGSGDEMTPRQRLVSVPFAITAKNVSGGTGSFINVIPELASMAGAANGALLLTGTSVAGIGTSFGVHGTGNVGVGGNSPFPYNRGMGVWGEAQFGYGVYGHGGLFGLYGSSEGGAGVGGYTNNVVFPGVWGVAPNGVGVMGSGATAGGSFEGFYLGDSIGIKGIGVKGNGDIGGEFKGSVAKGGTGVIASGSLGVEATGSTGGLFSGSFDRNGKGISARGKIGVYATGEVGVQGIGATAGGSFERTGEVDVIGRSTSNDGVKGETSASEKSGVYGYSDAIRGSGVTGRSERGIAVHGVSNSMGWEGVRGENYADAGVGVYGVTNNGIGVRGEATGGGVGVYGSTIAAGEFDQPFKVHRFNVSIPHGESRIVFTTPTGEMIYAVNMMYRVNDQWTDNPYYLRPSGSIGGAWINGSPVKEIRNNSLTVNSQIYDAPDDAVPPQNADVRGIIFYGPSF